MKILYLIIITISLFFVTLLTQATAESQKYNFQAWTQHSEVYRGDPIYLHGSLCPFPSTSDNLIQVKVNVTKPDGSTINFDEKSGSICDNFIGESALADMDGTWSAVFVADWKENNTAYAVTSNIVQISVKEPLFQVANVTHLSNITKVTGNLKWDSNGTFIVFQTSTGQMDASGSFVQNWRINPDGSGLRMINATDLQSLNLQKNSTQAGNMVVFSLSGGYGYGGYVYLKSADSSYQQVLYYSKNPTPLDPVISPDGKFVAFGSNNSQDNQQGIWLLELTHPIPEFPLASIILVLGFASVFVIYRIRK